MEDAAIIQSVQAGDTEAYSALVDRYAPAILAFTSRFLKDRADAEDAAQECFIRAYDRIGKFDTSRGSFKSWLFKIAASMSINELRRRQRQRRREEEASAPPAPGSDPETDALRSVRTDAVREALQDLPPAERQALLLVYYHEMGYREAGEVLGVPTGTVKSRVHLAVTRLRQVLVSDRKGES